jgi:hypothetical protein
MRLRPRELSTTGSQECFKEPREKCSISDTLREHKKKKPPVLEIFSRKIAFWLHSVARILAGRRLASHLNLHPRAALATPFRNLKPLRSKMSLLFASITSKIVLFSIDLPQIRILDTYDAADFDEVQIDSQSDFSISFSSGIKR